jgi:alkanesulfonate monooxygenase SsuD/methylene tetrahydromethanopterin reductase-like flavin-dependent oxidoreductase (luciferase family)
MEFMLGTVANISQLGLARQCEDLGYTHLGIGEGPLLFSEPYEYLALAARDTRRIQLGTWVTNPLTRLFPQTANAIATLNALAPGRVFLGLGVANNAMRSMGMRTARVAELETAVLGMRDLLQGKQTQFQWDGTERTVEFLSPDGGWYNLHDEVPIYITPGGPKSLNAACRTADGIGYNLGPDTTFIRLVRQEIEEDARKAGRDPKRIKLIATAWFYMLRPGETMEDAITKGFGSGPLSSCKGNLQFIRKHADQLNPELVQACERVAGAMQDVKGDPMTVHLDMWKSYLKGLDPRQLPLITKPILDTFCIWGTPDECLAQARRIADAGVDCINIFLSNPATVERDTRDFAECVIHRW